VPAAESRRQRTPNAVGAHSNVGGCKRRPCRPGSASRPLPEKAGQHRIGGAPQLR
jgi:hypothetical protein